jgi:hypothetical protein
MLLAGCGTGATASGKPGATASVSSAVSMATPQSSPTASPAPTPTPAPTPVWVDLLIAAAPQHVTLADIEADFGAMPELDPALTQDWGAVKTDLPACSSGNEFACRTLIVNGYTVYQEAVASGRFPAAEAPLLKLVEDEFGLAETVLSSTDLTTLEAEMRATRPLRLRTPLPSAS